MKTTAVIALYNGEKFIDQQLESILKQEMKVDEVIISDDGSKDNSIKIVSEFISKNHLEGSWRIIINQVNKGYEKNFIETMKVANGDIIFLCDQDDIWAPNKIKEMVSVMSSNPKINLLCGDNDFLFYDDFNQSLVSKELKKMKNDYSLEYLHLTKNNFHLQRPGCSMCIRNTFFKEILKNWIEHWAHDDFFWKFAIMTDSCAILHFFSITRRMHANNTARNIGIKNYRNIGGRIKHFQDYANQYKLIREYMEISSDYPNEYIEFVDKNITALQYRKEFITNRKIHLWVILFVKFRDCYPRIEGLYLDLFLVTFGEGICKKF